MSPRTAHSDVRALAGVAASWTPAPHSCHQALLCGRADARWGKAAHLTFFFFCILTNILVTSMLLLGGAAVVNALTGMNIYAVRPPASGLGIGYL